MRVLAHFLTLSIWLGCAACTGGQVDPVLTTGISGSPGSEGGFGSGSGGASPPSPEPSSVTTPTPTATTSATPDPAPTASLGPTPTPTPDPTVPSLPASGAAPSIGSYGEVSFTAASGTTVTDFVTTLTVPPEPVNDSVLFLWPGLQPGGANFDPINNGVLQPVLTWGNSCAPGQQPTAYSTWWVSAQYVNTYGSDPGYTGCSGGPVMSVAVGDPLVMHMSLIGTVWTQDITDANTGQTVSFSIDMLGQAQNLVLFIIESYGAEPVGDVIFTDTSFTMAASSPASCQPSGRGPNDAVVGALVSPDGMHCAVGEIVLRTQGVPVTNPGPGP